MAPDSTRPGSLTGRFAATTRVLGIEDDPDIAEFLRAYFRASGYDFVHCDPASADEGVAAIVENRPDTVLLDILLRGFSGLEIYRRARSMPSLALTPIVVVTADHSVEHRAAGTAAGIDGFVLKPFNVKTLAAVVGERIEAARALADAGGVEEGTELLTPALLTTRLTDEIHHAQVSGDPLTFGLVTLRTLTGLPGQAGQDAAGWLIREIAAQARTMLPEEFAMARSGNDELAVVAPTALPLQAARVLEHVLDELRGPRTLPGGESVQVEPVAGLAGYPQHAGDADGLFMAADAALSDAIDTRRPVAVAL